MAEEISALIFGACPCQSWSFLERIGPPGLVIAADGGVKWARAAGYEPELLVGDWDSGGKPEEGVPSVSLPPEKDLTDLQAAAGIALDRGCRRMIFTACLGGRLDQTLANLGLLEWVHDRGGEARLLDEGNEARFWDGAPLTLERDAAFRFLSILPLDPVIEDVTLRGVKYPLTNAALRRGDTLSISNEIMAPHAALSAKKGRMLVLRSQKFRFS